MVDFNNEAILSTDKYAYNNLLSVEKRQGVIDSLGKYERLKYQNANAPTHIVKAVVMEFYRQVRTNFKNSNPENEKEVKKLLEKNDFENFVKAFDIIDEWLFEAGSTRFVKTKDNNPEDIEEENILYGL